MEERQTKYTIMEGYELPSKGLIYDTKVNSHVELHSMSARDEMKRLSPSTTPLKTLADIIEGCMVEKPAIHVYDMAIGDYEYLLHKLRTVTYGSSHKVVVGCPFCGNDIETEIQLDSLEVKDFDINKFNELRTFTLPKSGQLITLKFQTPRMLDELEVQAKEMKRKFKDADFDFETLLTVRNCIDSIDGAHLDPMRVDGFIDKLPALDLQKLLQNIDKLNKQVGLDNTFYVTCPKCQNDVQSFFRFGPEFFRPTNI